MITELQSNVRPWVPDKRDKFFSHTKVFGGTQSQDMLAGLPTTMGRKPVKVYDQMATNDCTGFATAGAASFKWNRPLSPEWQAAKIGEIMGEPIVNGADPRAAMESGIEYGFLPVEDAPYTLEAAIEKYGLDQYLCDQSGCHVTHAGGPSFVIDWNNWDKSLDADAVPFKVGSYFHVDSHWYSPLDPFDTVRLALWQAKDENEPVIAFGHWYREWNGTQKDGISPLGITPISLHAYYFIDFVEISGQQYLMAVLSQGESFGNQGCIYYSRDVFNAAWADVFSNGTALEVWRNIDPSVIFNTQLSSFSLQEILAELANRAGSEVNAIEEALKGLFERL